MEPSTEAAVDATKAASNGTRRLPPPRPGAEAAGAAPRSPAPQAHGPSGAGPAGTTGGVPARPWSRWSVGVLTLTAVVLASAVAVHAAMLFLTLAPPNVLTSRNQALITSYVQPEFGQDWKLFAPNPKQRNDAIGVRLRTEGPGGVTRVSKWINLTAQDVAAIKGNPAPARVHQNMLRIAWDNSEAWHGPNDRPKGVRGVVAGTYLKRVVLQRVGHRWQGERITAVQIAGRYTAVPAPSWTNEGKPDTTTYRVLPWWPVTGQDYKGL